MLGALSGAALWLAVLAALAHVAGAEFLTVPATVTLPSAARMWLAGEPQGAIAALHAAAASSRAPGSAADAAAWTLATSWTEAPPHANATRADLLLQSAVALRADGRLPAALKAARMAAAALRTSEAPAALAAGPHGGSSRPRHESSLDSFMRGAGAVANATARLASAVTRCLRRPAAHPACGGINASKSPQWREWSDSFLAPGTAAPSRGVVVEALAAQAAAACGSAPGRAGRDHPLGGTAERSRAAAAVGATLLDMGRAQEAVGALLPAALPAVAAVAGAMGGGAPFCGRRCLCGGDALAAHSLAAALWRLGRRGDSLQLQAAVLADAVEAEASAAAAWTGDHAASADRALPPPPAGSAPIPRVPVAVACLSLASSFRTLGRAAAASDMYACAHDRAAAAVSGDRAAPPSPLHALPPGIARSRPAALLALSAADAHRRAGVAGAAAIGSSPRRAAVPELAWSGPASPLLPAPPSGGAGLAPAAGPALWAVRAVQAVASGAGVGGENDVNDDGDHAGVHGGGAPTPLGGGLMHAVLRLAVEGRRLLAEQSRSLVDGPGSLGEPPSVAAWARATAGWAPPSARHAPGAGTAGRDGGAAGNATGAGGRGAGAGRSVAWQRPAGWDLWWRAAGAMAAEDPGRAAVLLARAGGGAGPEEAAALGVAEGAALRHAGRHGDAARRLTAAMAGLREAAGDAAAVRSVVWCRAHLQLGRALVSSGRWRRGVEALDEAARLARRHLGGRSHPLHATAFGEAALARADAELLALDEAGLCDVDDGEALCRFRVERTAARRSLPNVTRAVRRWRSTEARWRAGSRSFASLASRHALMTFLAFESRALSPLEAGALDLALRYRQQWGVSGKSAFYAVVETVALAKTGRGDHDGSLRYVEAALAILMQRVHGVMAAVGEAGEASRGEGDGDGGGVSVGGDDDDADVRLLPPLPGSRGPAGTSLGHRIAALALRRASLAGAPSWLPAASLAESRCEDRAMGAAARGAGPDAERDEEGCSEAEARGVADAVRRSAVSRRAASGGTPFCHGSRVMDAQALYVLLQLRADEVRRVDGADAAGDTGATSAASLLAQGAGQPDIASAFRTTLAAQSFQLQGAAQGALPVPGQGPGPSAALVAALAAAVEDGRVTVPPGMRPPPAASAADVAADAGAAAAWAAWMAQLSEQQPAAIQTLAAQSGTP